MSIREVVVTGLVAILGFLMYFGLIAMWDALRAPRRARRFAQGRRVSIPLGFFDAIGVSPDKRCNVEAGSGYTFSMRCQKGQPVSAGRWISTLEPREEFIRCFIEELNACNRLVGNYRVIHVHGWERRHVAPVISVRTTDYEILIETLTESGSHGGSAPEGSSH